MSLPLSLQYEDELIMLDQTRLPIEEVFATKTVELF